MIRKESSNSKILCLIISARNEDVPVYRTKGYYRKKNEKGIA